MEIIWYIILWNIKDNSCIPFQMSTESAVFSPTICLSINVILERKCYFSMHIYLNVFQGCFQKEVILPQGKLHVILALELSYSKLGTVKISLLNQVSKVGKADRPKTDSFFLQVTTHQVLFHSVDSLSYPVVHLLACPCPLMISKE